MAAVDVQVAEESCVLGTDQPNNVEEQVGCNGSVEHGSTTEEGDDEPVKRNSLCGVEHSTSCSCVEEMGKAREELLKLQKENDEKQQELDLVAQRAGLQQEVDRSSIRDLTSANKELKEQLLALTSDSEQRGRDLDR